DPDAGVAFFLVTFSGPRREKWRAVQGATFTSRQGKGDDRIQTVPPHAITSSLTQRTAHPALHRGASYFAHREPLANAPDPHLRMASRPNPPRPGPQPRTHPVPRLAARPARRPPGRRPAHRRRRLPL